jgi:hypothetical protein
VHWTALFYDCAFEACQASLHLFYNSSCPAKCHDMTVDRLRTRQGLRSTIKIGKDYACAFELLRAFEGISKVYFSDIILDILHRDIASSDTQATSENDSLTILIS